MVATQPSIPQAEDTLSALQDPIPSVWTDQLDSSFNLYDGSAGRLTEIDAQYVGVYSEADIGNAPWILDSSNLQNPMWANVPANEKLALVVGDPSQRGRYLNQHEYDAQVPGRIVQGTAVIEKLSPTGEVVTTYRRETVETVGGGFGDPSELNYATVTLNDGIYRVSAEGSDFSYLIKVGNPVPSIDDALNTVGGALTDRSQEVKDLLNSGGLQQLTTTTNATGYYSFDVPSNAKVVTVTARKAPNIPIDPQNLTEQSIRDYYELDAETLKQLNEQQTQQSLEAIEKLQNTTIYSPSAPVTVRPPAKNVDITLLEVSYPQYGNLSAFQEKLGLLDELFGNESFSELSPALQQRLEDLTRTQKEDLYERLNGLREQNAQLQERYKDLLGDDSVGIDLNETSDAELRERISKLQQSLAELQSSIETGEETVERAADTITWSQEFLNVGLDLDNVVVRAHYTNGTSQVISDEYISVESSPGTVAGLGSSTVTVEEFPMPSDVAGVRFDVTVANSEGIGKASSAVSNPAFDGKVPTLSSVAMSTLSPGPSDTLSMRLNPAEDSSFKSIVGAEAFGPNGQTLSATVNNSTGEVTFQTNGQGVHTARLTFEDFEGRQHVLPVRIKAAAADRDRPTGIRAVDTPFGTIAQVGDGLENGAVDVDSSGAVVFTAQAGQDGDLPNVVHVYDSGLSVAPDSTRTVRVVRGDDRESISRHVEVVYHTAALNDDALLYRGDSQPITRDASTRFGDVSASSSSTTISSWTDADGELTLSINNNPGAVDRLRHWVAVRTADIDIPFIGTVAVAPAVPPASAGMTPALGPTADGSAVAV
ncbi:hypothetical protein C5C07_19715 [Haloferax sp. Atlit-4N]|nr:hypothetical protein C5C07_19715 [Haloferax sp. Atlit-4N]